VTLAPQPQVPLSGTVVWAGEPPEKPVESQVSITLMPLHRFVGGWPGATSSIPGEFAMKNTNFRTGEDIDPLMDEYRVSILRLPGSLYLKDVTYGGESILHKPLQLGSAMTGSELRVILDHDGGTLKTHVVNSNGEPVGDANVMIFPKETASPVALASTRITKPADQNGEYTSPALAPGSYYVLATQADLTDLSPETLSKLFDARSKAEEVEIGPNETVSLTLKPVKVE
jgi:hypothetical protein